MLKELSILLEDRDIQFDPVDQKVMCYGHVVDLASGRVINGVTSTDADEWDELPELVPVEDNEDNEDNGEEPNAHDPIALARSVVQVIRASGARRDAFDIVIDNGNAKGWFKQGHPPQVVKIKKLQLLRQVCTHWDSVYSMLRCLREMQPVCHLNLIITSSC
jgi:hypothetical protein